MQTQNQYIDYLIDPSFQGVNRLFVLPFEVNVVWTGHLRYFLPTVELKDYNIDWWEKHFDWPIKKWCSSKSNTTN